MAQHWIVGAIVCVMLAVIAAPAFAVTNQPAAVDSAIRVAHGAPIAQTMTDTEDR